MCARPGELAASPRSGAARPEGSRVVSARNACCFCPTTFICICVHSYAFVSKPSAFSVHLLPPVHSAQQHSPHSQTTTNNILSHLHSSAFQYQLHSQPTACSMHLGAFNATCIQSHLHSEPAAFDLDANLECMRMHVNAGVLNVKECMLIRASPHSSAFCIYCTLSQPHSQTSYPPSFVNCIQ